jgi:transglutaminase-like putative cysteine protease
MSRLRIVHDTIYRYRKPVTFGPHRLVLRPREGHDVDVESMTFEVQPSFELAWSRDVFSNSIATLTLTEPSDRLHIRSIVVVDRADFPSRAPPRLAPTEYPVVYDPLEICMANAYRALAFPEDERAVRAFVFETLGLAMTGNVELALPLLNERIHERVKYRRREQKGVQPPAETLALASGSCRDKASLFMECARVLGVAARFASGYLDCPASEAGRAATHAWAEVYLPNTGWCGFDPTLGETTSWKHVVVGVSNHPRGVMPVSGSSTRRDAGVRTLHGRRERFPRTRGRGADREDGANLRSVACAGARLRHRSPYRCECATADVCADRRVNRVFALA